MSYSICLYVIFLLKLHIYDYKKDYVGKTYKIYNSIFLFKEIHSFDAKLFFIIVSYYINC